MNLLKRFLADFRVVLPFAAFLLIAYAAWHLKHTLHSQPRLAPKSRTLVDMTGLHHTTLMGVGIDRDDHANTTVIHLQDSPPPTAPVPDDTPLPTAEWVKEQNARYLQLRQDNEDLENRVDNRNDSFVLHLTERRSNTYCALLDELQDCSTLLSHARELIDVSEAGAISRPAIVKAIHMVEHDLNAVARKQRALAQDGIPNFR